MSSPMFPPDDEPRLVHVPVDIPRGQSGKDKGNGDHGVFHGFTAGIRVRVGECDAEVDDGELRRVLVEF